MEITNYTRKLTDRAATQIVRELSKTSVGELLLTGADRPTHWVSVDVQVGPEGGIRYIRVALGLKGNHRASGAPGLIDAIAKRQPEEAHRIVERIIETAVAQAIDAAGWRGPADWPSPARRPGR